MKTIFNLGDGYTVVCNPVFNEFHSFTKEVRLALEDALDNAPATTQFGTMQCAANNLALCELRAHRALDAIREQDFVGGCDKEWYVTICQDWFNRAASWAHTYIARRDHTIN